jgi:predicted transcriptional regulator
MLDAVARGMADIEAGRYSSTLEEAFEKAESIRRQYA